MGGYNIGGYQVDRFKRFFSNARIGEAVYGFSDQYEDDGGGTITILARSPAGDEADMLKIFPQMTHNEYLYELSVAQLQLMASDSSHVKYLKGKDKEIWDNYQKILKAQKNFSNFLGGMGQHSENKND